MLFLAEAFTRPAMMHGLGKIGFSQSYTYFTWRTTAWEMREYCEELVAAADYMRPNFWPNTPDILHESLQHGGPPMFKIRAVLASMLSPSWGMYAGYELFEHVPRPGAEEYLDNEKYELRPRDWAGAEAPGRSLARYITRLNGIRRDNPALHRLRNLRFHEIDNPALLCWSKRDPRDRQHRPGGLLVRPARRAVGQHHPGHAGARPRLARAVRRDRPADRRHVRLGPAQRGPARPVPGAGAHPHRATARLGRGQLTWTS